MKFVVRKIDFCVHPLARSLLWCIGDEVMALPSQMQVYIKRWRPSTYTVDTYDEVILTDATPKHLKQQVCFAIHVII